jgi:hypothetical protein
LATKQAMKIKNTVTGDTLAGTKAWWNGSEDTLIFNLTNPWEADATYRVTLVAATGPDTTRNIEGTPLAQDYSWPFTTLQPSLLASWYDSWHTENHLLRYTVGDTISRYDAVPGIWPVLWTNLCYDRAGNNYVVHDPNTATDWQIGKFSYDGASLGTFQTGRHMRSIATDDTTLFVLLDSSGTDSQYRKVLKVDPQTGASLGGFNLQDVSNAYGLAYSPFDQMLYVSSDSLLGHSHIWNPIQKYTKDGTLVSQDSLDSGWLGNPYNGYVAVNKDYIFYTSQQVFSVCEPIIMQDRGTMAYAGYIMPALYDPYGGLAEVVVGMAVDANHLYAMVLSTNNFIDWWEWILATDRFGDNGQGYLIGPDNLWYSAIAIYPSLLGTPEMFGGGGPHPGGLQAAGVNSGLPRVFSLGQSYPNPANGALRIAYALPRESRVRLNVYNVSGQLVRSLRDGVEKPGAYEAAWDGKDQDGRRVSSGVYLYRMEAGSYVNTLKMVLVR